MSDNYVNDQFAALDEAMRSVEDQIDTLKKLRGFEIASVLVSSDRVDGFVHISGKVEEEPVAARPLRNPTFLADHDRMRLLDIALSNASHTGDRYDNVEKLFDRLVQIVGGK